MKSRPIVVACTLLGLGVSVLFALECGTCNYQFVTTKNPCWGCSLCSKTRNVNCYNVICYTSQRCLYYESDPAWVTECDKFAEDVSMPPGQTVWVRLRTNTDGTCYDAPRCECKYAWEPAYPENPEEVQKRVTISCPPLGGG
jgi:hypothetical protein